MCRAPTKAATLEVLSQYLWAGREVCCRYFFGSADILHVCRSLFMFVCGDRFVNPQNDPACSAGGMSFCTTRHGGSDVGENIATMEDTITALDGANFRHEEVTTTMGTKLAVVVGPLTTETETGTHAFVLHYLLEEACPVVEAILYLVGLIDRNRTEWVQIMVEQETTTRFAYDMSWIVSAYLNTYILVSTVASERDTGYAHRYPFST